MSDLVEVTTQETLLLEEQSVSTLEFLSEETVTVVEEVLTLVSEAVQGPQGIPGPQGPAGSVDATYIAGDDLSGHRMVTLNSLGQATYASNDVPMHANRIVGMTRGAATRGSSVIVQSVGELTEPSWSWDESLPVYLGANGLLTQVPPKAPEAAFSTVVGFPISSTTLHMNIGMSITLAQ